MALVDDDAVVFGQNRNTLDDLEGQHRVIGDDHICLASRIPRPFGETVLSESALARAHALRGCHRHRTPHSRIHRLGQVIAIPGVGRIGPFPHRCSLCGEPTTTGIAIGPQRHIEPLALEGFPAGARPSPVGGSGVGMTSSTPIRWITLSTR